MLENPSDTFGLLYHLLEQFWKENMDIIRCNTYESIRNIEMQGLFEVFRTIAAVCLDGKQQILWLFDLRWSHRFWLQVRDEWHKLGFAGWVCWRGGEKSRNFLTIQSKIVGRGLMTVWCSLMMVLWWPYDSFFILLANRCSPFFPNSVS